MLDLELRRAIVKLKELGHSQRAIARTLKVSRNAVRRALKQRAADVSKSSRPSVAELHRDRIVSELFLCKGKLVRVHEELTAAGIEISYSTLVRFVRENHLLKPAKPPAGRYDFPPGKEAQFDTSPHRVTFVEQKPTCQCASLILGYSRMLFFQYYRRFSRFEAKLFLTSALQYLGGSARRIVIDNTHVVLAYGTGPNAVMSPEMETFSKRFNFKFMAHNAGDADRSGKVERPFHYIENNFLIKRTFTDFVDLNRRALIFCEKNNQTFKRRLKAKPVELFAVERLALNPLPAYIPQVYRLFQRIVDVEGYINLHTNTYSVPYELIGKRLEVRETLHQLQIFAGHQEVAVHSKRQHGARQTITVKEHRPAPGLYGKRDKQPLPKEKKLRAISLTLDRYVTGIKQRSRGRAAVPLRKLERMQREYPPDSFHKAVETALKFGMFALDRLERMILRQIDGDYFRSRTPHIKKEDQHD